MRGDAFGTAMPKGRAEAYALVVEQVRSLLEGRPGPGAAMATVAALLKHSFDHVSWVGFYLPDADGSLVVGPYQGPLACIRLPVGKGVCQAAAQARRTVSVADVHAFPGHIACDSRARSEIVVPVLGAGRLLALLDVDSHLPAAFSGDDERGLEAVADVIGRAWPTG